MRTIVKDDQGNVDAINTAVYGTCAVIIKYNNLVSEALAVAKKIRLEPSSTLVKAWISGQNMRRYFDYNDSKPAINSGVDDDTTLKREPSLYAGADEEVLLAHSLEVIEKVKFLLRCTASSAVIGSDSNSSHEEVSNTMNITSSFTPKKPKQNDAANKWKLATQATILKRQISEDSSHVLNIWHSLVGEAAVLDKLRNTFVLQRKFAERRNQKQFSTTEKILNFIQGNVKIVKLNELNVLRNKRAVLRSKGLDIYATILQASLFPYSIQLIANSFAKTVRTMRREDSKNSETSNSIHYLNAIEGCSPSQNGLVCQKYARFFNICVKSIQLCNTRYIAAEDENQLLLWEKALISCLKACVIDFESLDHNMLDESGILDELKIIFQSESESIRKSYEISCRESTDSRSKYDYNYLKKLT
jgi:hypothetical protein